MPTLRQRISAPFRTLGWKLTLSYTLVTVAALLVVELILLAVGLGLIQNPDFFPSLAAETMIANAVELVPFLDEEPIDRNGLESWLIGAAINGFHTTGTGGQEANFTPGTLSQGDSRLYVLDTQEQLLAIVPEGDRPPDWPELKPLYQRALDSESALNQLFFIDDSRQSAVAVPIQSEDGRVYGLLVYTGTIVDSTSGIFSDILPLLASSALVFTISAGIVGAIFGLITSRGLVKRLKAVSLAADSWSQADFSIAIPDRSSDELGQLARRLNQMSAQLETLMETRQELASLEERNRLARDLHDSVKQQVFATAMQVGAARELMNHPQAAEKHLVEAERLASLAQQELTVLIRELRPAALEGRGLTTALRDYLVTWSQQNSIQTDLRVQGERMLPLTVEQTLYRVVQEALANIARHSAASRAEVHIAWRDQNIVLTVSDNGHGFNPEASTHKGIGLHSMRERVEGLDGKLQISSSSAGTIVEITCPIP